MDWPTNLKQRGTPLVRARIKNPSFTFHPRQAAVLVACASDGHHLLIGSCALANSGTIRERVVYRSGVTAPRRLDAVRDEA